MGVSPMPLQGEMRMGETPMLREMRTHLVIIAAIVLAVGIVYAPTARQRFIVYDDDAYVAHNPHVLGGLSGEGFVWAFTSFTGGNWHPLTWLSHMIDAQIVGDRA